MTKMFAVLVAAVLLTACNGEGITDPTDPTVTPTSMPTPGNSFTLDSFSPAAGTTMKVGDGFLVSGRYTLENANLGVGFAFVRDDGDTIMWTVGIGYSSQEVPSKRSDGWLTITTNDGRYYWMKGHRFDAWFVIGEPGFGGMMTHDGKLDQSKIRYKYEIATQWMVEGPPV